MDGWRCVLDVEEHIDTTALTDTEVLSVQWVDAPPSATGNNATHLLVTLPNAVLCCKADGMNDPTTIEGAL
jgi:hypothetical protein